MYSIAAEDRLLNYVLAIQQLRITAGEKKTALPELFFFVCVFFLSQLPFSDYALNLDLF